MSLFPLISASLRMQFSRSRYSTPCFISFVEGVLAVLSFSEMVTVFDVFASLITVANDDVVIFISMVTVVTIPIPIFIFVVDES